MAGLRLRGSARLVLVAAAVAAAAGCGGSPDYEAAIRADLPVVDGSTSTEPMRMLLVCGLLEIPCDWVGDADWAPERWVWPRDPDSATGREAQEHVVTSGTHESVVGLVAGDADVIVVAREPSEEERAAAKAAGVVLEVRPVAVDAFVFLVNGQNPVASLTLEQIRGIYSGQVTDWSQVGGPTGPIQPYQRDPTSGSQELMLRLVMGDMPMIEAPDWLMLYSMTGPFSALAVDPSGIGYSVYYYAEFMQPESDAVKLMAVEGVLPTAESIGEGEYPLRTEVFAVTRADADAAARAFFDWLAAPAGQDAIAATGYLPLP